jgi:hypothetical protein
MVHGGWLGAGPGVARLRREGAVPARRRTCRQFEATYQAIAERSARGPVADLAGHRGSATAGAGGSEDPGRGRRADDSVDMVRETLTADRRRFCRRCAFRAGFAPVKLPSGGDIVNQTFSWGIKSCHLRHRAIPYRGRGRRNRTKMVERPVRRGIVDHEKGRAIVLFWKGIGAGYAVLQQRTPN